jgi:23S rRNA-/tRNA-specific pseudouridylate synthase
MPTQPARDRKTRSLDEILRAEYRQIYLVHRLDTPASGVVLFARTREAAAHHSVLFATRAIEKTYLAVVRETFSQPLEITTPIDGKEAVTRVQPLRGSLVQVEIATGRLHQIRIHLASLGHPITGDARYGGEKAARLMLHAWKLRHAELGELVAPPPAGFPPL